MMTIFLYKSAQVLLLFFCSKPTNTASNMEDKEGLKPDDPIEPEVEEFRKIHSPESYARVKRFDDQNQTPDCGAVWFSGHSLLTSASCLTEKYDLNRAPYIEVRVSRWEEKKDDPSTKYGEEDYAYEGEAIVHPLYKKNEDGLSFGYDLAVVRANVTARKTAKLCSKKSTASRWILHTGATGEDDLRGYGVFHEAQPNFYGLASIDNIIMQYYFIDHRKQFTTYSSNFPKVLKDGDPIFDFKKNCVAGIKNFDGVIHKKGKHTKFITSTKVYPVKDWIEHTRQYLKKTHKDYLKTNEHFNANEAQPGSRITGADLEKLQSATDKPVKLGKLDKLKKHKENILSKLKFSKPT